MDKNSDRLVKAAHYITAPFGKRTNPVTGRKEFHNGYDYGTHGLKVPCYAVSDGTIARVSRDRYGANFVYVRFPALGHYGLYYHLDRIDVKTGKAVTPATRIGIVGKTGQATGIHLHFSWIADNSRAMQYYHANYEDFEKYVFPDEKVHSQAYQEVQRKFGFEDQTMMYMENYKYGKDLLDKLLLPRDQRNLQTNTMDYLSAYRYGKDLLRKISEK